jgi:outer membrane receptor protein involved in Fe transport
LRSGYLHVAWKPVPNVTLSPGLRISESTLVRERAVSRWILGAWSFRPGWRLDVSAGVAHQFPPLGDVPAEREARSLRPERAMSIDVGIEQRLTPTVRWQATLFGRDERDIVGGLDRGPWLATALGPSPRVSMAFPTLLDGASRGLELLVARKSDAGLSGWVAYSHARTRYTDRAQGETYWADFDQRHALSPRPEDSQEPESSSASWLQQESG